MPPILNQILPYLALAAGTTAFAVWLWLCVKRWQLAKRPVLLGLQLFGVLPALYLGLVWCGLVSDRYLRIERPWLALVCAVALSWLCYRLLSLSPRQNRVRRVLTEFLVLFAALCTSLAAMGLELGKPLDRLAVLVVVDRSRSIDLVPEATSRINAEIQAAEASMREEDRIGIIAFGADAAVEDPLRPKTRLPAPQQVELGRDGTDLANAIRRALAEVPVDAAARIVLLSDGVATRGNTLDASLAAIAAQVPIDVVPLDQRSVPNVRLVSARTASRASEGEPLALRVVTQASQDSELKLNIYRNGELLRSGQVSVKRGEDVFHLREEAPGPGLHRFDVRVSAVNPQHDESPEDNVGSTFVRVRGPSAALILEGDPGQARPLERALTNAAFRVDTAGASESPADIAALAAYDLVVLSDIPASLFSPQQLSALGSYVRDLGGGLLLMGGDRSLGPGGYGKTPVEEVSPVSFDLKQERKRASLSEIIVIDYSGSMAASAGKHTKLELANEASARSAELLGSGDRLGVMHVDTAVSWTVPLGPITDKAQIVKAIRDVQPGGGGIYVDLGLRNAFDALRKEKTALKHVLLFSDGGDAEEKSSAFSLITGAKHQGITTSVVALGRGKDVAALEQMSRLGDGRFYLVEDAQRLPAIFAQETILAARSAINETVFTPAVRGLAAPTRQVDFGSMPSLAGYVVTIPKARTQVLLDGPEGDPVLATWSVGLGRSAVFTSDYKDRWGAGWTAWEGAQKLFAQLARDISRLEDDPKVRVDTDASGGELHVRATVVDDDGRAENFRRLKLKVAGPDGYQRELSLDASGPGVYSAKLPLDTTGAYIATVVDEISDKPLATTGSVLNMGEELRPTGTDRALLSRIAVTTEGSLRDTLAGIFNHRVSERFAYRSLDSHLLWIAALSLLLGVGARRLAIPTWLSGLPQQLKRRLNTRARQEAGIPQESQETMTALLSRKAQGVAPAQPASHSATQAAQAALPSYLQRGGQQGGPAQASPAPAQHPPGPNQPFTGSHRPVAHQRPPPVASSEAARPAPSHPGAKPSRHASQAPSAAPTAPSPRTQTAAEILLERRRKRR